MSVRVSWGIDSEEEKKIVCYSNETGEKKKIATFDANNFANIFTAFQGTTDSEVTKRNVIKNINQYIYDLYLKILNNSYLVGEDQSFKDSKQKILTDFISKINSNNEINKKIIDEMYGKKIGELRNNNAKIDEFIKELCIHLGFDKNEYNRYDGYYFIPYNGLTHGGYNYSSSIMLSPVNYFKYKDNSLKEYTNKYSKLSDIVNFKISDIPDSFKDYLNRNTAYYNDIILKYVPDNNEIRTWIKKYEDTLEDKGFKFGSEKEKIETLVYYGNAGTSLDKQTVEIPKYVTESSTKNKEEVIDQVIKYGFLGNNPSGSFITYATRADIMNFPSGEENYKIDKDIVGDYDIYKYGAKEIDFNNKVALGEYITNGLKYLHNNNTINSLVNNNANIKSYFNSNCGNFLKDYDSKSGFQEFNDVDNYYDFYSASTPYVSLTFCYRNDKGGIQKVNINSVEYPFIKSFNCVDEGVKTFTIKLFDRDFNSLINIYNDNGDKIGESTLEQILALSVGINNTKQENDNEESKYSLAAANYGDVVGTKVSEDMQFNLGIIFGYSETNPKLTHGVEGIERTKSTDYLSNRIDGYTQAGNTKYLTNNSTNQRTHRWWETSTESSESDNKTLSDRVNSSNQTTIRTELVKTLIIGYQTEFSSAGIYYTIKAIEASQSELSKYKIYQRYTNIKGTPSEVLYTVMNMVNSIFDSKDGGIKLYIDESCKNGGKDVVIEDYEKEEESKDEDNVNKVQEPKQVQISLGSKDALSMYQDDLSYGLKDKKWFEENKKPKLYKSVLSILNDLKAVMPPKVVDSGLMKDVIVTDQDGNSVKAIQKQNAYRRFTYGVQVDKDKKVKVYFYYQQPTKFEKIRKYEWGPANGKHSVITNIDIKTDNEYALLTSMSTITEKSTTMQTRDGGIIELKKTKREGYADYIAQPGESTPLEKIAYAYSQALYKGSITIMGDPFYCFDKFVQPFTYPIYLDFRLPVSQSWSKSSNANKIGYSHFMSGFYVVTKITHDINDSGFRTILEVMSYPNITNDVLG